MEESSHQRFDQMVRYNICRINHQTHANHPESNISLTRFDAIIGNFDAYRVIQAGKT